MGKQVYTSSHFIKSADQGTLSNTDTLQHHNHQQLQAAVKVVIQLYLTPFTKSLSMFQTLAKSLVRLQHSSIFNFQNLPLIHQFDN